MLYLKHACAVLATSACVNLFAQTTASKVDSLAAGIVKSLGTSRSEKVLLQTDRKVYAAGEKIWFNALLVKAINNKLATTSKNLFVDLVNDKDSVIKQLVLNVAAHRTDGAIDLPDSLAGGYYWLRGYTLKMVKDGATGITVQPLYVLNAAKPQKDNITPVAAGTGQLSINFFPEGGALITGTDAVGVLQVKNTAGNAVMATGYIADSHDSVITRFSTNRFGLARVAFYPKWFLKYRAVIHTSGQDIMYPIIAWDPFAAQLAVVKQDDGYLHARITLEDSIYERGYTTYLLGISRDSVCFAGIGRGMCQVNIPVNKFPGGTATLLLFNEDRQLVSERKVFIDRDNYSLDIKTDKTSYGAREPVNLSLAVRDAAGAPMVGALNVAVEDDRVMAMSDQLEQDSMLPLGLPSDEWLKRNKGRLTADEIDLLLLAQPPSFKILPADKTIASIIPEDDNELLVNLKGKVYDAAYRPLPGSIVTGIIKEGNNAFFAADTTTAAGGFRLHLPDVRENLPLMLQVTDREGKPIPNYRMDVDTFSFPRFATPAGLKQGFNLNGPAPQAQAQKYHADTVLAGTGKGWLAAVTVKTTTKAPVNTIAAKRMDPFSHIITSEMIGRSGYGAVINALLRIPGIAIRSGFLTFLGGDGRGGNAQSEPLIIVDGSQTSPGSPVPNMGDNGPVVQYLNLFPPGDIDFIEVLMGADAAIYGMRGGNGVIIINTKTGGANSSSSPAALKIISPKTYHSAPAFDMPDYSTKELKETKVPDTRNTIYWAGNVITDVSGKAQVTFYTADAATTYTIVVTGITANGESIYSRISINRK